MAYQGPLLPGQDQAAFRRSGIQRSGGSSPYGFSTYGGNQSGGQVLGASYYAPGGAPAPTNRPMMSTPLPQINQPAGPSPEDLARQEADRQLNAGYDDYYRSLDAQLGGLNDQRGAQEQIANNTYNQGMNTVNSQYGQGQAELAANRQKTLRDLSSNLMQSFQQGNSYLGTRGASDSSASGQYAYALTKEGNRQRGDIHGQYDQNLFKLKTMYDTETKNLELAKNSELQQISQWFAEAQGSLQGQKGQAALQKSQQALSVAMQLAQQVQQDIQSKRSTLDQWAANHATSFQQLAGQLQQSSQFQGNIPTFQGITGGQQAGGGVAAGYGGQETRKDLFGNVIQ